MGQAQGRPQQGEQQQQQQQQQQLSPRKSREDDDEVASLPDEEQAAASVSQSEDDEWGSSRGHPAQLQPSVPHALGRKPHSGDKLQMRPSVERRMGLMSEEMRQSHKVHYDDPSTPCLMLDAVDAECTEPC